MCFFKSFKVILSDANATKKVNINAKTHSHGFTVAKAFDAPPFFMSLISSKINPPTITGMLSKKLNSEAFSSSFPVKIKVEMVLPDLDIPGRTAKP